MSAAIYLKYIERDVDTHTVIIRGGVIMLCFLFPGQGSQTKGMGANLFESYKDLVDKADRILGYSIKELCLNDPKNQLGETQFTQPALYIVNCLSYLDKIKLEKRKPEMLAGHSLGEYCALFAAGVFNFEDGLKLVKKRGEIMSQAKAGGMAAVIGLKSDAISKVIKENFPDRIQIANLNSIYQTVISGDKEVIMSSKQVFIDAEAKRYIPLNVSAAFHSFLMEDAKKEFTAFLEDFEFDKPEIQVISNYTAKPYRQAAVKRLLAEQITGSVRWVDTIRYMVGKGEFEYYEIGPGSVLTKLVQEIVAEAGAVSIDSKKREPVIFKETGKNSLGSDTFKKRYQVKYAYATGGMYKGIASVPVVVEGSKNGILSFFGSGGLTIEQIENAINAIKKENVISYGVNLLHSPDNPAMEEQMVDICLSNNVPNIELSAFMNITPAIGRLRIKTLAEKDGEAISKVNLMAKLSRPEVADAFLRPVPEKIITKLLNENKITEEEAKLARRHAVADDICAEADSGGHTDAASAFALLPSIQKARDDVVKEYEYSGIIHVGLAGGIGTPNAAAAAFVMGADFILTGSINQCTVEAGTSDEVKNILQDIDVQNTDYAPAGDMFEMGAKVQVVKKGILFPARANRLYELYRQHNSINEIDAITKKQLEERYFGRSFDEIYKECQEYWRKIDPAELEIAEKNPKHKMAMIFKWYFGFSTLAALSGNTKERVNFQIHCGPALGSFNQWVKGTSIENWRNRSVGKIGGMIMDSAEKQISKVSKSIKAT